MNTEEDKVQYPYRIFISFSHGDEKIADKVRLHLTTIGAKPMSDQNLDPGLSFTEEIKKYISYAHIFIPILTESGSTRPWVHQEIGFALGMGIPILPLAIGSLPEGLTHQIHAISLSVDLGNIADRVTTYALQNVMERASEIGTPNYQCAEKLDDRTNLLIKYAKEVFYLKDSGKVRIKAAFSSFTIPINHPSNPIWIVREGQYKATEEKRKLLMNERLVLEKHVQQRGCDLILEPFHTKRHDYSTRKIRWEILIKFLESFDDDHIRIAFLPGSIDSNLTMVGDFFLAEAVVPYYGASYHLTTFTKHGPTVLRRVQDFDLEMEDLLEQNNLKGLSSRQAAIDRLKKEIAELNQNKD
jgi:hypothetical protein